MMFFTNSGSAQTQLARSARFGAGHANYMTITPAGAGNRKTWTADLWMKVSSTGGGTYRTILNCNSAFTDTGYLFIGIDPNGRFYITGSATVFRQSNQRFLDPTAWYNCHIEVDTTNATGASRIRVWVNGTLLTWLTANDPTLNADLGINQASAHNIGLQIGATDQFDGYFANFRFIDGVVFGGGPSLFGRIDSNSEWQPYDYSGGYGLPNGYRLTFSDNSSTANLGLDTSGNSNNWTPTNFSVTAGVNNDSLFDTPTDYLDSGSQEHGNFPTFDSDSVGHAALSNGNLTVTNGASFGYAQATERLPTASGKYYWEFTITTLGGSGVALGISIAQNGGAIALGRGALGASWAYDSSGSYYFNSAASGSPATFTSGDIIGVAFDCATGSIWFSKNGTFVGNPVAGTGAAFTGISNVNTCNPALTVHTSTVSVNFGQRAFTTAAPSGFSKMCALNLPSETPAIPATFTGNASADGPILHMLGAVTGLTVNSNVATKGTHYSARANGAKIITASGSYNINGSNTATGTATPQRKYARAQLT